MRAMTLIAVSALAAAVLFRLSPDNRLPVCIIVCMAAFMLAMRSLFMGKIVYALLFLAVLGGFTPLHSTQFSPMLSSIFDLMALALFAASPMMFRKSLRPAAASRP